MSRKVLCVKGIPDKWRYSRDAAESRVSERSNGVGGDPCDKLIFITSWVAALTIGRRSGSSYSATGPSPALFRAAAATENDT